MDSLFPDRANDGKFQNPATEELFDFWKVMQSDDPKQMLKEMAYYPTDVDPATNDFFVFIPGLGQVAQESSKRSVRYASRLQVGVVNLHNGSFLKDNPFMAFLNPYMDWIDAFLDRLGLSGSPVIDHAAQLILQAAIHEIPIRIAADSHGTIFLARAIRRARNSFLLTHNINEDLWEERTSQFVNIVTFGNGHRRWPKGPNYVMVYIEGDVLPERVGLTKERNDRPDIQFLKYNRMFPEGSFEAHNMMFTIELLKTTFEKNGLTIGDTPSLFSKLNDDSSDFEMVSSGREVEWPNDLASYAWDPTSLESLGLKRASGSMNTPTPLVVGPSDEYLPHVAWTMLCALVVGMLLRRRQR